MALCIILVKLMLIKYRQTTKIYKLYFRQKLALWSYFGSIFSMLGGVLLFCMYTYYDEEKHSYWMRFSYISWTFAIPWFICAALLMTFVEGIKIADTRGYKTAKRISRSFENGGWEFTQNGSNEYIWLLGEVQIRTQTMKDILSKFFHGQENIIDSQLSQKGGGATTKSYQNDVDIEAMLVADPLSHDPFSSVGRLSEIELPEYLK